LMVERQWSPSLTGIYIRKRLAKARAKLASGPAKETKAYPSGNHESYTGLTGTGFAQPKPNSSRVIVPIGSRCRSGFKLSRP